MQKLIAFFIAAIFLPLPSHAQWNSRLDRSPKTLLETGFAYQGFDCVETPRSDYGVGLREAWMTNSLGSAVVTGIAERLAVSEWGWGIVDVSAAPDWDGTFDAGCENDTADDCEMTHSGVANNDGAIVVADVPFDVVCANMTSGTNAATTGVMAVQYYNGSSMATATQQIARTDETDWATANGRVCVAWRKPHDWVTGCTAAVGATANCSGKYVAQLVWTTTLDAVIKASQVNVGRSIKSQEALADNSTAVLAFQEDVLLGAGRCFMPFFGGASGTTGTNALNSVFLQFREIK